MSTVKQCCVIETGNAIVKYKTPNYIAYAYNVSFFF